jgi:hypothetical protein
VSSGPKSLKVIVPLGLNPPESVAVSRIEVPSRPPGEALVLRVGAALVMTTVSAASSQAVAVEK